MASSCFDAIARLPVHCSRVASTADDALPFGDCRRSSVAHDYKTRAARSCDKWPDYEFKRAKCRTMRFADATRSDVDQPRLHEDGRRLPLQASRASCNRTRARPGADHRDNMHCFHGLPSNPMTSPPRGPPIRAMSRMLCEWSANRGLACRHCMRPPNGKKFPIDSNQCSSVSRSAGAHGAAPGCGALPRPADGSQFPAVSATAEELIPAV
jgi:hypothetical protein